MSEKTTRRLLYRPPHTYRSAGAGGMTMFTTYAGLGFAVLIVFNFMLPSPVWFKYAVFPLLCGILFVPLLISIGGRSMWEVLLGVAGRKRQTGSGEQMHRAGPFTGIPFGTPVPGLAAKTRVFDVHPADGSEPFALIHLPSKRFYTVSLRAWPQGREWIDQSRFDLWVARLGDTVAFLAQSPDVVAIVPVLETVPESGQRASTRVRARLRDSAPSVVRQAIVEAVEDVPAAEVRLEARIAITFTADTSFRKRSSEEMALDLSRRLRKIMDYFEMAGVLVRPMLEHEIAATTRRAFSPGDEFDIETGLMTGEPMGLDWGSVGPVSSSDQHGVFLHDSAQSVSWTLEQPPEAAFDSKVLADLLSPRPELPRKRVTFVYQPYTPAEATSIVNKDDADARQAIRSHVGRLSERAIVRREQADAARAEQARGAGVTRVSMIVTATAPTNTDTGKVETLITNLGLSASLKLRIAYDQQGPTFLAGLGIGIVLAEMASSSDKLAA
ncbi:hypothetical protein FOS14_19490 [Skermania sp. ID1734]|uniref:SCO6880 family protein n=1 Tax=Skermania sp. ID1734 TaxID=2597516 RepID=UPI00117C6615|nr:SCO6880 family protein [Skermania sp. ID1734]TSD94828.1 hypothetical protein FOS14_19490 [Skermania sp. ID1734]